MTEVGGPPDAMNAVVRAIPLGPDPVPVPDDDEGGSERGANERTPLALAAMLTKLAVDNVKGYGLDRGRTVTRFAQLWKAAPPVGGKAAVAAAAGGVAVGVPLAIIGAKGAIPRLGSADPIGGLIGSRDGMKEVGILGAGLALVGVGIFGPRTIKAYASGSPLGRQLGHAVIDVMRGPTTGSTPVTGVWGAMHGASQLIGMTGSVVASLVAATNIASAVEDDGADGVVTTKAGRTGLILAAGAVIGLGFHYKAGKMGTPGMSRLQSAFRSPWLMKPHVRNVKMGISWGMGVPFMLNEAGAFNFLNHNDGGNRGPRSDQTSPPSHGASTPT